MPSPTEITVQQLSRRIGLPDAPAIVDVRIDEDFRAFCAKRDSTGFPRLLICDSPLLEVDHGQSLLTRPSHESASTHR